MWSSAEFALFWMKNTVNMGVLRLRLLSISRQQQLIVHSGRPKVIDPKFSRNIWNILPNNTVTKPHLHIVVQDPRGQSDQLFCLSHVTESAGESRMPRPLRPPPPFS
jgi:hypothetical protein